MKNYIKGFLGFSIGPILGHIISLILIPITTRMLEPGDFGISNMFILFNNILNLIVLFGIDQSYMRFYNDEDDKNKLLQNCLVIPMIISFIAMIVMICFRNYFAYLIFDNSHCIYPIIVLAIINPLFVVEKFLLLNLRMSERAKSYSLWNVLSKAFNFVLTIALLKFYKQNFESVIFATLFSQLLVTVLLIFVNFKNIKFSKMYFDKMFCKKIFEYGLPLVFATAIGWGLNSMDSVFLRFFSNYDEIGYYSVAMKIANLLLIVQSCFTTYWIAVAMRWKKEQVGISKYNKVSQYISFLMIIIFIAILTFKDLVPIVVSDKYLPAIYIMPFLLFYPIFYTISETFSIGILFSNKTSCNIYIAVGALLVNLVLNYTLIPILDGRGAAIATGLSYLVFFWLRVFFARKLWHKFSISRYLFISIIAVILALINTLFKSYMCIPINIVFAFFIFWVYRDIVNDLWKKVRRKV